VTFVCLFVVVVVAAVAVAVEALATLLLNIPIELFLHKMHNILGCG
jgi:hypothetical protein